MAGISVVLPMLALVVGVASLFVDPKAQGRKGVMGVLLVALLATCAFSVRANLAQAAETRALQSHLQALEQRTAQGFEQVVGILKEWGYSGSAVSPELVDEAVAAERERARLAAAASPSSRRGIEVHYYPKDVDREKVESALRTLGFALREGVPNFPDMPTNAVFFGEAVPIESVKLVAFTLMRAGVQISTIRPFTTPGLKPSVIDVGSLRDAPGSPPLTAQEIAEATQFPMLERAGAARR